VPNRHLFLCLNRSLSCTVESLTANAVELVSGLRQSCYFKTRQNAHNKALCAGVAQNPTSLTALYYAVGLSTDAARAKNSLKKYKKYLDAHDYTIIFAMY